MGREWEVLSRRSILRRPPWLGVYEEQIRLPDGRVVEDFYSISIPDYVVVAAFDKHGRVLMERHYRHGARRTTWSLPSGYIDPGEDALSAAKRELLEETGFQASAWESLGRFGVDGNRGCGWANLFIAEGVTRVAEPSSRDLAEIDVELKALSEVMASVFEGDVAELPTAAALALASTERARRKDVAVSNYL